MAAGPGQQKFAGCSRFSLSNRNSFDHKGAENMENRRMLCVLGVFVAFN
jgi:hypothetical protein